MYIRKQMLDRKLISPADTSLYKVTDSVDEAVAEVRDFYRVYHSMRYVRGDLVLRIQRRRRPSCWSASATSLGTSCTAGRSS